jgi:hypothetical protein
MLLRPPTVAAVSLFPQAHKPIGASFATPRADHVRGKPHPLAACLHQSLDCGDAANIPVNPSDAAFRAGVIRKDWKPRQPSLDTDPRP